MWQLGKRLLIVFVILQLFSISAVKTALSEVHSVFATGNSSDPDEALERASPRLWLQVKAISKSVTASAVAVVEGDPVGSSSQAEPGPPVQGDAPLQNTVNTVSHPSEGFLPRILLLAKQARNAMKAGWLNGIGAAEQKRSQTELPELYSDLGRFALAIESSEAARVEELRARLSKDSRLLDPDSETLFLLLSAKSFMMQKGAQNAKLGLAIVNENADRLKKAFQAETAKVTLQLQLEAGLSRDAFETLRAQRSSFFSRDGSPLESDLLIRLARQALSSQNEVPHPDTKREIKKRGESLLYELARLYPITPVSVSAYEELKRGFPNETDLGKQLWPTLQVARTHAEEILKRLGQTGPHRSFALELAETDLFEKVKARPVDEIDLQQKLKLLATAEWFVGVREYRQANEILSYLISGKRVEKGMERDKLTFLYARSCNSVNRPDLAAESYQKVFTEFPKSTFAQQARKNFILSLHYSRKHREVIAQIDALNASPRKLDDSMQWQRFWSLYLSGSYDSAEVSARSRIAGLSQGNDQQKYLYWLARILERKKKYGEALKIYDGFEDAFEQSSYSILARWRTLLLTEMLAKSKANGTAALELALQAKRLEESFDFDSTGRVSGPRVDETSYWNRELVTAFHLSKVGLGNFARSLLQKQNVQRLSSQQSLALARLAVQAEEFSLASNLGKRALAPQWSKSKESYPVKFEQMKLEKSFEYPLAFNAIVKEVAAELDFDASLIFAVMKAESHFDPDVTSWVGARGLMQIMPGTGARISKIIGFKEYHPDMLYQPEVNIALGAWYLKRLLVYYRGDLIRAIAAYNAGPEAVDRWAKQTIDLEIDEYAENIPFGQTHAYVRKVLSFMDAYYRIYSGASASVAGSDKRRNPQNAESLEKTIADAKQGLLLRISPQLAAPEPDMEMF